jgi:predicted lipoprotein with Yx(FWY)xxD motif
MRRTHALPALLFAGFLLASCSSGSSYGSSSSNTTAATTATTAAAGSATTAASGGSGTAASGTVNLASLGDSGQGLVNGDGMTLYLFEQDNGTTSACTGGCAQIWPALTSSSAPVGGSGVAASKLSTANGQVAHQVTYNGHLLYTFSGDHAPGDVNGTSIPDWYPVNADGNKIDAS